MIGKTISFRTLTQRIVFTNIFAKVPMAPPDPIIGVNQAFLSDTDNRKVNLGVGAYRDDNNKPYIFKVVKKVEQQIINDPSLNKEYIPIEGLAGFNTHSQRLVFGEDSEAVKSGRIVTVQALSGTGSLRVGFEFLNQEVPSLVWVSNPTWANHHNIINRAGLQFKQYPYYDPATRRAQIDNYLKCLNEAQAGNIILMHAAAHNPTGVDPTSDDWKKIAEVMKKRNLVPYFDSAYQGFASGDIIKDAWPVRYFTEQGFTLLVSQSYAKNMGMYGERVGALHVVTQDKETASRVLSQLKMVIRANYSSPPVHGARIVERVLSDAANLQQWKDELSAVAGRIIEMRSVLRNKLEELKTPGNFFI
jgi:aspartate aminotransferase